MEFHVITLFPEMFESPLAAGMLGRAIERGLLTVRLHGLRQHGLGNYRQVDDTPYGGGSGMVMRPEPIAAALDSVMSETHPPLWRVLLTPQGEVLDQSMVQELAARKPGLVLIAGRYEGVDERIRTMVDQELSIGDYVLSGGEVAAMVVIEAVARLIPGVLGNPQSVEDESFSQGVLEYPQYTRPEEFRGLKVPEILLSGDHEKIRVWRKDQARERTAKRRPDLLVRRKP
jgi:tRNA (guanine37-N1)-methyltransferase